MIRKVLGLSLFAVVVGTGFALTVFWRVPRLLQNGSNDRLLVANSPTFSFIGTASGINLTGTHLNFR